MTTHPESLWLAVRGAFRGGLTLDEVQEAEDELNRLTRQHDALLEALRTLLSYAFTLEMRLDADGEHRAMQIARAAIAKAEEA